MGKLYLNLRFEGIVVDTICVHSVTEALDIFERHSLLFEDQNESIKADWLEAGGCPNPIVTLVYETPTDKKCPRCGTLLYPPDVQGYDYTCYECDDNFYECELKKDNTISYERAIQIIQKLFDWIDDCSCETAETRDTLIDYCHINRDEIKELGYGYLLDTEENKYDKLKEESNNG